MGVGKYKSQNSEIPPADFKFVGSSFAIGPCAWVLVLLIISSATLARAAGECTLGRTRYMFIRPNLRLVGKLIVYINGADNIAPFSCVGECTCWWWWWWCALNWRTLWWLRVRERLCVLFALWLETDWVAKMPSSSSGLRCLNCTECRLSHSTVMLLVRVCFFWWIQRM